MLTWKGINGSNVGMECLLCKTRTTSGSCSMFTAHGIFIQLFFHKKKKLYLLLYSVICICVVWVGDVITNSIWRQSDQSCFFCFLQGKYSNWHLWKSMNGVCGNLIFAKNGSAAVLAACRRSERFFKIRIIFGYDAGSGIKTCNIY